MAIDEINAAEEYLVNKLNLLLKMVHQIGQLLLKKLENFSNRIK
jgi:hypothetical protein